MLASAPIRNGLNRVERRKRTLFFSGKKILLLYARFFGYDRIVCDKLRSLGAEVDLYDARADLSSVGKAVRKITSTFYYHKQKAFHENIRIAKSSTEYDFVFCNDVLDTVILQNYRNTFRSAVFILYLDDSIENMKGVEKTFPYYDRILTFDRRDANECGFIFRPLFYCDAFDATVRDRTEQKYRISFVGTCHSDRMRIIRSVMEQFSNDETYFYCYLQSWFMYYYHVLREPEYRAFKRQFYQYRTLSMPEVATIMNMSQAILDIQHPQQTGLTMRTIETVGAGKKLITTNDEVREYDFYRSENILIIDRNDPKIDRSFFDEPFCGLPDTVLRKYKIDGWIEDVFQM